MRDAFAAGPRISTVAKLSASALALILVSGCAQERPRYYSGATGGKEYFAEGKYGKASPRVVLMGENVPKGGGRYLIGRPYRIAGRTYVPSEKSTSYSVTGTASWYGAAFHGRRTANGEIYDMASITAAHPTMPLPSYARVTNLKNGKSIVVRVNDRGPYHGGRVMDMSSRVADLLEFKGAGTARVKVDYLGKAGLGGSDDRQLAATLSNGAPAQLAGYETPAEPSAVAVAPPEPAPAAPRPEPARRAPAPPPIQTRAAPEEEAQAVAAPPAPAPPVTQRASAPPRPSKPTVLDAEAASAEAAAAEAAPPALTPEAAAEAQEIDAPLPETAPTPPRRPTAFNDAPAAGDEEPSPPPRRRAASAPSGDDAEPAVTTRGRAAASLAEEDATPLPAPAPRRRAAAAPAVDADGAAPAPKSRRRAQEPATAALYFAPDSALATRFSAPGQPFSQLRDMASESGR